MTPQPRSPEAAAPHHGPAPLREKALDCLTIASLADRDARGVAYNAAVENWSEKAIFVKMTELQKRGYITFQVHPFSAVLTEKGRKALLERT